jgi:hypothetical protein
MTTQQSQPLTQLAMFDYAALDSETRIVVQQRTTEIKALMKRAATDIIEIGQKLIEVKGKLGHGHFGAWLAAEFTMTDRTARNFMRVAEAFKSETVSDLIAPKALYLLAAPSTLDSAREEAIERAEQGEPISYSTAREIVTNHRPPRQIVVPRTLETTDLIGDGIDDVWDSPMEPAQVADLFPRSPITVEPPAAAHHAHERRTHIMRVMGSSESPEWYTPQHIIDRVVAVFGQIDLDPCSNSCDQSEANVPALSYYTAHDDGLAQPWHGRVYMNPPYGDAIPAWVERLINAYVSGEATEAIALLPARIDTIWFRPLWDYALCFVYGRLRFSGAENSAPFPSVVAYLGPDVDLFRDQFGDIGRCGRFV